jgi:competence protein ComFC
MHLLDLLFPKKCVNCRAFGSYICSNCFARISFDVETICVVCNNAAIDGITHPNCKKRDSLDGVLSSVTYNSVMKKALYAYKYAPFIKQIEGSLIELFYEGVIQKELFHQLIVKNALLVPIPLHPDKLKSRGYNQSEMLAEGLGQKTNIKIKHLLYRQKKTHSQFSLSREERKQNIEDAFGIKTDVILTPDMTILLIDDIVTTGATLLEAAKVLKKQGVKEVWGVTLAHGK